MPPQNVPRRQFLRSSAVASGLVGASLAGCTDLMDDGEGAGDAGSPGPDRDRPAYAPYVPAEGLFTNGDEDGQFGGMYVYLDFESLAEYEDIGVEDGVGSPGEPIEGSGSSDLAFMAGPTVGLTVYALGMFGLVGFPFTSELLPTSDDSGSGDGSGPHETSVGVLTSFGYAFLGDYDVDALAETAEDFEAVEEREGFTVFEGQSSEGGFSMAEGLAFAASPEAVLLPLPDTGDIDDPEERTARNRETIGTMLDVAAGEADSVAASDPDVDWALRTTGHGAFGIGTYGDGRELTDDGGVVDDNLTGGQAGNESEFFDEGTLQALEEIGALQEGATVYGSDFALEGESEATGHVALAYDASEDVPSDEEFESVFGDVDGEFTIESGETRVFLGVTRSLENSEN